MKKAFTLIELLVVIAIIAILAAILFPVFAQAKAAAKKTAALSSVKQIGTASAIYYGDTDDTQVPYLWYNRGDGVYITYMEMVQPYVKNKDIWVVPSMEQSPSTWLGTTAPTGTVNVSNFVFNLWTPFDYWNWGGQTAMFSGFPIEANEATAYTNGPCDPAILSSRPYRACTGATKVENPSQAATIVPGYFITYKRPTGAEKDTVFGSAYTVGWSSDDRGANFPKVYNFTNGNNFGFADTSARFINGKRFNKDASRSYAYGGGTYPASPFMQVR